MVGIESLSLKKIKIDIENLLLDPNNPRFSKHPDEITPENKFEDKEIQDETFRLMQYRTYEIRELADSIKSNGFAQVDNIFVKKIKSKYVVVEGNRRISAIKLLLINHKNGTKLHTLSTKILEQIKKIDCIDLSENSSEEIDFILGLRHHGSIMRWDLLPASFNVYKRYMMELCQENKRENISDNFTYNPKIAKIIANLYSLKITEVKIRLRNYRIYLQIKDISKDSDLENKFSIIDEMLKKKSVRDFFDFDETLFIFEDEKANKFSEAICGNKNREAIIKQASAGNSTARDFGYIIDKGDETFIDRVFEGENTGDVKADLQSRINDRNLIQALEAAYAELSKIKLKENFKLAEVENEKLGEIQIIINKIRKLGKI
ncbi:MAG: ParB N-terminal domain-containing protein [Candidatus Firestonebacteria bacterium]